MSAAEGREAAEKMEKLANHEAWTVKEAAYNCLAALAEKAVLDRIVVKVMADTFDAAVKDRKYAKCRIAGYKIAKRLCKRAELGEDKTAIMELVVVYKEAWQGVVRKGLSDADTDVTQVASELVMLLGRWP